MKEIYEMMDTEKIPENVKTVLNKLKENGCQASIVGGAVRDCVMGIEPHDWDIATNAMPEQTKKLFRCIDTGLKHGTVTAILGNNEGYEITTFRTDGKYSDGRHPDNVEFVNNIEQDLARRDFTMNAMAMDVEGHIIDPFHGMRDINDGIIRCAGNPDERFKEDALRMLRAVRFEAKFGFSLDMDTREAIERNCFDLINVSDERVRDEFTKMLMSDNPKKGFIDLYETGIAGYIFPEFDYMMECKQNHPSHYADVGSHTLDVVSYVEKDPILRWAALLHDIGKPASKEVNPKTGYDSFPDHAARSASDTEFILTRLRFPNAEKAEITELVRYHDWSAVKDSKIRKFAAEHGYAFIRKLQKLKWADIHAHSPEYIDKYLEEDKKFINKALGFIMDGTAINICDLKIDGNDLLQYGYKGKEIGEFLEKARNLCLGQPSMNDREKLLCMAARQKGIVFESISENIQAATDHDDFER